ncbi:Phage/plasmid maintenance protein [Citrobacter koseri]|nr:Phage/plasmid maintenance protein [Citrobacter koseri]
MRTMNYSEVRQNLASVLDSAATGTPVALRLPGLLDPVGRIRRSRHPAFCFLYVLVVQFMCT